MIKSFSQKLLSPWYPERYHGRAKTRSFFEGWYYKIESADGSEQICLIAGISKDQSGIPSPFIQYMIAGEKEAHFESFAASDFKAATDRFYLEIGSNRFSREGLEINLPGLSGKLEFKDHRVWPKSLAKPNIMGPAYYWQGLQCYHSLVSFRNEIKGKLKTPGHEINLNHGCGYIEKDWGNSFPTEHIWLQSNRFEKQKASLSLAAAPLVFAGWQYLGFAALLVLADKHYLFANYNGAALEHSFKAPYLSLQFSGFKYQLHIKAKMGESVPLWAPSAAGMDKRVRESLQAELFFELKAKRSGRLISEGKAKNVGMEVSGNWN